MRGVADKEGSGSGEQQPGGQKAPDATPASVTQLIAQDWGVSHDTVKQMLKPACSLNPFVRVASACRRLLDAGQRAEVDRRLADILALVSSAPSPSITDELLIQETDLEAEVVRLRERFALNRNATNRAALSKALHKHEPCEHALCLALDGMGDQ